MFLLHFFGGSPALELHLLPLPTKEPREGTRNLWEPTLRPASASGNYDLISKIKVARPPQGRGLWSCEEALLQAA